MENTMDFEFDEDNFNIVLETYQSYLAPDCLIAEGIPTCSVDYNEKISTDIAVDCLFLCLIQDRPVAFDNKILLRLFMLEVHHRILQRTVQYLEKTANLIILDRIFVSLLNTP